MTRTLPVGSPVSIATVRSPDRPVARTARGAARGRLLTCVVLAVCGAFGAVTSTAAAATSTFSFTGTDQAYTVPQGVHDVLVTATGGAGGGPTAIDPAWGFFIPGGRAAAVSGFIPVWPGQVLYVEVGGMGGKPAGGFNGGGTAGRFVAPGYDLSSYGGGGATDLRLLPRSNRKSSLSRIVVAAGGGGSAHPAAGGGDAGQPGPSTPAAAGVGGGAGTKSSGGAAGCAPGSVGCGTAGTLGIGGNGGTSTSGYTGGGGGGGLYGGGGGAGDPSGVGGGGGGSSAVPPDGTSGLAPSYTTPPSATIETAPCGVRRLSGSGTKVYTVDTSTNPSPTTAVSSGQLSHLGAFTGSASLVTTVVGLSYTLTGTQTLVAANGDKLLGNLSGNGVLDLALGTLTDTNVVTITGGTGRFNDAIGTYQETESGTFNFPTTPTTANTTTTISGQISYCPAHRHSDS